MNILAPKNILGIAKFVDRGDHGQIVTVTTLFFAIWRQPRFFRPITRPMSYEEVCAENNLQFAYHVPVADKPDF